MESLIFYLQFFVIHHKNKNVDTGVCSCCLDVIWLISLIIINLMITFKIAEFCNKNFVSVNRNPYIKLFSNEPPVRSIFRRRCSPNWFSADLFSENVMCSLAQVLAVRLRPLAIA